MAGAAACCSQDLVCLSAGVKKVNRALALGRVVSGCIELHGAWSLGGLLRWALCGGLGRLRKCHLLHSVGLRDSELH